VVENPRVFDEVERRIKILQQLLSRKRRDLETTRRSGKN
jgi:hypothetical protein